MLVVFVHVCGQSYHGDVRQDQLCDKQIHDEKCESVDLCLEFVSCDCSARYEVVGEVPNQVPEHDIHQRHCYTAPNRGDATQSNEEEVEFSAVGEDALKRLKSAPDHSHGHRKTYKVIL